MGKTAFSAPQSEIAGAVLATRMEQKISQELFNVSLSPPVFIGDSEIILKMIAKNDPAGPPVFYGARLMEILSLPHQKTGSGVQAHLTQPTYSPDLAPIVTRSTPSSGYMAVSFLRRQSTDSQKTP